jgi:hypothetical protein
VTPFGTSTSPALGLLVSATVTGAIRAPRRLLASTGISRPDSSARVYQISATVGASTDPAAGGFHTSLPGCWTSWIVMVVVIALLAVTGRFRAAAPGVKGLLGTRS